MLNRLRAWYGTWPLQRRVAFLTSAAVALAVAVTSVAGYATLRVSLYSALDDELIDIATSLNVTVARDIQSYGGLTDKALRAGNIRVEAIKADGQTFRVPGTAVELALGSDEVAIARLHQGSSTRTGQSFDGRRYRIVAIPMAGLNNYALVLGRPLAATDQILSALWLVLIIFGTAGVLIARVAGNTVARSGLRPVRELRDAVEQVTATKELRPITISADGDMAQLAESFNEMLRSLASSRERQRRLIADAGHELRTPLTSMRTNIELLAADAKTGMLSDRDREEIFSDVTAQMKEFTQLIGDLVQLARDDPSGHPEVLDFRDVVNSALERARRRGHGLVFDVELDPLYVYGESDSLERALTNLLDNAVKWSPPGGTIRVQLEGDRLRVADAGPGIAEVDLPHVFDRFYRADTARNTPGTGLGLSIVAQTIAQHGGSIEAGRSAQGGAEFIIHLPGSINPEGLEIPQNAPTRPT